MYRKWFFTLVLTCLLPFGAAGQWHTSNQYHFDNAIQFLPLAMELGLGFCTPHQQTFTDRFLVAATGYLVMGTTVFTLKTFTASKRPDSDATNSFPSGHTATAFLGAELVRLEYGTGWAIGAYSIATLTAVMRVYPSAPAGLEGTAKPGRHSPAGERPPLLHAHTRRGRGRIGPFRPVLEVWILPQETVTL